MGHQAPATPIMSLATPLTSAPGMDPLSEAKRAMKSDWNERARENALYYVESGNTDWERDEFFVTGAMNTSDQILDDLDTICVGIDPKQMVILEIGCGVGRMTKHLAEIFGRVEAVDVSGEMIARARENLADLANVRLHETNGVDLAPFSEDTFDFCFSYIVFQHIPLREAVVSYIQEVHRTLKSGRLFKFQVKGADITPDTDTWRGVGFSEQDMLQLAEETGFDVARQDGQGTQYFWNWWIRR
jgi:SAM-dependent methyltransferase